MNVAEIQREVLRLPDADRQKLTAWMVTEFPVLAVDRLMAAARDAVAAGTLQIAPPTRQNFPQGKTLDHAMDIARRLGLDK